MVSEVTRIALRRPIPEQEVPQVTRSHERLGVTDQDREVRLDKFAECLRVNGPRKGAPVDAEELVDLREWHLVARGR